MIFMDISTGWLESDIHTWIYTWIYPWISIFTPSLPIVQDFDLDLHNLDSDLYSEPLDSDQVDLTASLVCRLCIHTDRIQQRVVTEGGVLCLFDGTRCQ